MHRADHQQDDQEGGQMEGKEAQGQVGGQGAHQGNAEEGHVDGEIGPLGVQLQLVPGAGGTAHHKQAGEGHRPHQAVEVVPPLMGGHEHDHHEQAQEQEGAAPQCTHQAAEQAAVPHPLPRPVGGLEDGAGDVDDGGKQAAGDTPRPGPGYASLPPHKVPDGAAVGLADGPVLEPVAGPAQHAVGRRVFQAQPDSQEKADKEAAFGN